MKKTNSSKAFVEISSVTLSAIKNVLFSSEGLNLLPIVKDLSFGQEPDDLTSINVALTFKNAQPDIDTSTRFDSGYCSVIKYEFVGVSIILNKVLVKSSTLRFDKKTQQFDAEWQISRNNEEMSLLDWFGKSTDFEKEKQWVIDNYQLADNGGSLRRATF